MNLKIFSVFKLLHYYTRGFIRTLSLIVVLFYAGMLCATNASSGNGLKGYSGYTGPDTLCQADFSYNQVASLTIQFTDQSTGILNGTYLWSFADGTSSQSKNPLHHFYSAGIFSVTLHTTDTVSGCQSQISKNVIVGDSTGSGCHADFTLAGDNQNELLFHFTNQSSTEVTNWFWDFDNPQSGASNSSIIENPSHLFTEPGIYHVCLTIGGPNNCHDIYCHNVYVSNSGECQAQFSYHPDSSGVSTGIPYRFVDLSGGNISHWTWSFGDGTTSHETNPLHSFSETGNHHVCLAINGQGCQSTWCQDVDIADNPGCYTYYTYQTAGLAATFNGFMMSGTTGSFTWDFGDGGSGSGVQITHTFSEAGIYPVSLHSNDSTGCNTTFLQNVAIGTNPQYHQIYGQVYSGNFPPANGTVMIFSVDTTGTYYPFIATSDIDQDGVFIFQMVPKGNYYIYALPPASSRYLPTYYGDGMNWQNALTLNGTQPENPYNIHLFPADSLPGGTGKISGLVRFSGLKSSLVGKVTMLLMNDQGKAITYDQVSDAGNFTFPTLGFGTYYLKGEIAGINSDLIKVLISADQPQADVTMTFNGDRLIGIDNQNIEFTAGPVFPNPVSGEASITITMKQNAKLDFALYGVAGSMVKRYSVQVKNGTQTVTMNVSALHPGIYSLRAVTPGGEIIIRKLVKL